MFNESLNYQFSVFNTQHFITLAVLITILVLFIVFKKYFKEPKSDRIFRYSLATLMLVAEVSFHIWVLSRGEYGWDMIPFTGFCATTNLFTIIALYTNNHKIASVTIYYSFVGAFFALMFADITYGFPHFRYFGFFIVHFGFLLGNLHFFLQDKLILNRKYVTITMILMASQALFLLGLDLIFSKNWFYFIESPVKEVSDFFGSPWYSILWFITIGLMVEGSYQLLRFLKKPTAHSSKAHKQTLKDA
jgi:hypothetical integral membrane protein (TIGR02206 family)